MTPRQIYWISIEVLSIAISIGIAFALGFNGEGRGVWIALLFLSVVITFFVGMILEMKMVIPQYMMFLNGLVYFLIYYGLSMLVLFIIIESIKLNELIIWVLANIISAIVSFLLARRKHRKKRDEIIVFVNNYIVNTEDE